MFLSSLPSVHAQTTPKLQLSYIDQIIHICCHIMHAIMLHVIYYCSHLLYKKEPLRWCLNSDRVRIQAKLQAGVPSKGWYLQWPFITELLTSIQIMSQCRFIWVLTNQFMWPLNIRKWLKSKATFNPLNIYLKMVYHSSRSSVVSE